MTKNFIKYICEGLVIAGLLLTNVVMGNFTRYELVKDLSISERIYDALTYQNIGIAVVTGMIASFVLWHIIRK